MLPKFSMAASCLTMTFFRAMRTAPLASVTETIMGSSSGVRPTASATENRNVSSRSRFNRALTRNTNSTRKTTTCRIRNPNRRVPRSNSVSGGRASKLVATRPNSVAGPVATMTATPSPLITEVPRKTAVTASPSPPATAAGGRLLLAGQRLAGERGFVDEQVPGREKPASAGHQIAGRLEAGSRRPPRRPAPAPRARPRRGSPSRSGRPGPRSRAAACCDRYAWVKLSATLSTSISAMITAADRLAERGRDHAGHEQDQHERVGEVAQQLAHSLEAAGRGQLVGSQGLQARGGLCR